MHQIKSTRRKNTPGDIIGPDKSQKQQQSKTVLSGGEQGSQSESLFNSHGRRVPNSSSLQNKEDNPYEQNFESDEMVKNLLSNMSAPQEDLDTKSQLNKFANTLTNMDEATIVELLQMKQALNSIIDNALETKSKKDFQQSEIGSRYDQFAQKQTYSKKRIQSANKQSNRKVSQYAISQSQKSMNRQSSYSKNYVKYLLKSQQQDSNLQDRFKEARANIISMDNMIQKTLQANSKPASSIQKVQSSKQKNFKQEQKQMFSKSVLQMANQQQSVNPAPSSRKQTLKKEIPLYGIKSPEMVKRSLKNSPEIIKESRKSPTKGSRTIEKPRWNARNPIVESAINVQVSYKKPKEQIVQKSNRKLPQRNKVEPQKPTNTLDRVMSAIATQHPKSNPKRIQVDISSEPSNKKVNNQNKQFKEDQPFIEKIEEKNSDIQPEPKSQIPIPIDQKTENAQNYYKNIQAEFKEPEYQSENKNQNSISESQKRFQSDTPQQINLEIEPVNQQIREEYSENKPVKDNQIEDKLSEDQQDELSLEEYDQQENTNLANQFNNRRMSRSENQSQADLVSQQIEQLQDTFTENNEQNFQSRMTDQKSPLYQPSETHSIFDQQSQQSTVSVRQFAKEKFYEYIDIDDAHGISLSDFSLFVDRSPKGYKKVRLLSKLQHQVYWLFKKEQTEDEIDQQETEQEDTYYIIQQIPRALPSFHQKLNSIQHAQQELYQKMQSQQGMRNLIFDCKEIIDNKTDPDVWVIYETEPEIEQYFSLHQALWSISFDPKKVVKTYSLDHACFFQILNQPDGRKFLAYLIYTICQLLKNIADIGAMYGNVRTENIMIKLDLAKTKIEAIKFLSFGHIVQIEEADTIMIPEQVEHLPPAMLSYLMNIKRFQNINQYDQATPKQKVKVNVKFLQESASADIFGLGIVLLQIATGCPSQLELPVKFKCKTVKNKFFLGAPHFGHCQDSIIDDKHVDQTIKLQERLLNNLKIFLRKGQDHYGLLSDKDFVDIMTRMISANHYSRPNVLEIMSSKFITYWKQQDKRLFM